ncbi:MAG: hypothetical protein H7263_02670 [Candidatus Sericytochromatia bacterium]|nr:hypothetical protein [Candidatus Sericytochromatia bacterium]
MNKISLAVSIFSVLLTFNAYAENEVKTTPIEKEINIKEEPKSVDDTDKIEDKGQVFDNIDDRTLQLNKNTTDASTLTISSPFAQSSFVPDISLILDSSYAYRNITNNAFDGLITPSFRGKAGFPTNGFNLNYAELSLASTIDTYFDLMAVLPFSTSGVAIEEAFINSRSLPFNFQLKAGKFRSSFGRLNSQHEHSWDFTDAPLVYSAFFGGEQLNEKGVQINWLAPTDTYLLLGVEGLQGENEASFGTKGFEVGKNKFEEVNKPNLLVAFAKTSVDIENLTILGGLTFAGGGKRISESNDDKTKITDFDGSSKIYAGDLTFKYFFDSYRYLSLQSEYMYRSLNGINYSTKDNLSSDSEQSGLYSQLIWRFDQLWRTGVRFDMLNKNDIYENTVNINSPNNLMRYSAMLEYNPTEFSRIRLQYNHDRSKYADTNLQPVNEIFLQLNMAIGSHAAHAF